ncbi:hypothetical protein L1077_26180 [Pseudoalteromonas luteoviolacea]|uniref:hypothetical protein n=1 Tax=Pseudoalteromonas luteoviolacea TaxID=43657 RepID=UPI001F3BDA8B|nr:hypothetical protein [Pseudoalteromonas luteoviolacea]MCF6442916.1 hypothetical protein [Pseudoalteromonas luteoviolacea]
MALALSAALNNQLSVESSSLASDLEWFFSWKLKACYAPEYYWCDGVEDIELKQVGKYEFQITAMVWIGPESNVNDINKANVIGNVVLKPTGKAFKSYQFIISYRNDKLALVKS